MFGKLSQQQINDIVHGSIGNPFDLLGMHISPKQGIFVRVLAPHACKIDILDAQRHKLGTMTSLHPDGLFQMDFPNKKACFTYWLKIFTSPTESYITRDPYSFLPFLSDFDLHLMSEGSHKELYKKLGAHPMTLDGVAGVSFAVWAPNAKRVSVVGPFNNWDGRRHMMRNRTGHGVWELFIPLLQVGDLYKYEIMDSQSVILPLKTDPVGFNTELRPKNASIVFDQKHYTWHDQEWTKQRCQNQELSKPLSIYEVHLGSWRRNSLEGNRFLTYREMAKELPEYLDYMGFTHVEFLPLTEHPFDGSWGYQSTGMYAPTSRYGTPDDFKYLIDTLHQRGYGVIMDWVPSHFPKDDFGLSYFDGTALYEPADTRKGEHKEWGTKIYNYERKEVANFLLASALFWLKEYHIDGLRVDAVASMLYLDYGRKRSEATTNIYGGYENIEAINFLRRLNEWVYAQNEGYITIAEESTIWPLVSRPTYVGGLGFTYKWNMGWMNDSLQYMRRKAVHRKYHQLEMTFSLSYAFTENFVLPLSHDEIVHGKGPLIDKMTGDRWQKFANLRAYFGFMYAHPGKKLMFMGNEFAQDKEWKYDDSLSWHLIEAPEHKGVQRLVADLNRLVKKEAALHENDCDRAGFDWIDGSDIQHSVVAFMRFDAQKKETLIICCNFTPATLTKYRLGAPYAGIYREIFNSNSQYYGGTNTGNKGSVASENIPYHGKPYSINLVLPPLSTIIFKYQGRTHAS